MQGSLSSGSTHFGSSLGIDLGCSYYTLCVETLHPYPILLEDAMLILLIDFALSPLDNHLIFIHGDSTCTINPAHTCPRLLKGYGPEVWSDVFDLYFYKVVGSRMHSSLLLRIIFILHVL